MENNANYLEKNVETPAVIGFLKSVGWVIAVLVLITVPLMVHTQHLIIQVAGLTFEGWEPFKYVYGIFFAIGFDVAILTMAIHGRERGAAMMAFIVFLFNAFFLNYI